MSEKRVLGIGFLILCEITLAIWFIIFSVDEFYSPAFSIAILIILVIAYASVFTKSRINVAPGYFLEFVIWIAKLSLISICFIVGEAEGYDNNLSIAIYIYTALLIFITARNYIAMHKD